MRTSSIQNAAAVAIALTTAVVFTEHPSIAQQAPQAGAQQAPKPANIDRNGVLMLVRSSIFAVDQANKTGNYTVLRDLGAPGFQAANDAAKLAEIFAKLRNDKVDLSGVAVIDPQLSLLPQIEANGMMHMAGFFPSVPSQVNFELLFSPVDGQWRLFGISVNVGPSGPVAPDTAPQPSEANKQKQKQPSNPQQSAPITAGEKNAKH